MSGWRLALLVVVALVVLGLLLTALFWVAALAAVIVAVAAFNLLGVPRLASRLHVPELAIVGALLVILAAGGWLVGGTSAAAAGAAAWVLGVVVPRVALRRFRRELDAAVLRAERHRATVIDLERSSMDAPSSDDDGVITYRRRPPLSS